MFPFATACLTGQGFPALTTPGVSPSTLSGSSNDTPVFTSGSAVASAVGGSGTRTYSWARQSGSTAVVAVSPSAASTTFQATMGYTSVSAVFRCTIADTITGESVQTSDVTVNLNHAAPPLVVTPVPSGSTVIFTDAAGDYSGSFSVSVSGGVPPYIYFWGGGAGEGTDTNYVVVHVPDPGGFLEFAPACTVTDSIGQSQNVAVGPFTYVRPS